MRDLDCAREPEILRAIAEGRRPENFEDDLREHLAGCGICSDLIEVGIALACDRESVVRSAPVPAAGAVWWRTQIRMRREAEQAARRTVSLVQGAILGASTLVALGILVWVSRPLTWLQPFVSGADGTGSAATAHATSWSHWLFPALVAWVFLILAAVRYAVGGDASASLLSGSSRGRRRVP